LATTSVTGWSTFRIGASGGGVRRRGALIDAVNDALDTAPLLELEGLDGCVGLALFLQPVAAAINATASAKTPDARNTPRLVMLVDAPHQYASRTLFIRRTHRATALAPVS
jgi:hypothetical protein